MSIARFRFAQPSCSRSPWPAPKAVDVATAWSPSAALPCYPISKTQRQPAPREQPFSLRALGGIMGELPLDKSTTYRAPRSGILPRNGHRQIDLVQPAGCGHTTREKMEVIASLPEVRGVAGQRKPGCSLSLSCERT